MKVVDSLVGATITGVGVNELGEIMLSITTNKGADEKFIIGKDEDNEIAIFGAVDDE